MGLVFKSSFKSQSSSSLKLSKIMQFYFVLLLVAAASASPITNLLKHKANNAPVLNLNHKNVHTTHHVPVEVVAPQVVPQVYSVLNKQVVPQVYSTPVVSQKVVPQVYSIQNKEAVPQVYSTPVVSQQVVPQVYSVVNKPVVQQAYAVVQTPELTPGYVAATHGSLHTSPLPEGPAGDGYYASHH